MELQPADVNARRYELYWVRAARLLLSAAPEHLFAPRFKELWNRRYPHLQWDASRGGLLVDGSPSFELELPGTVRFERGSASIMLTAEDLSGLLPQRVRFTLRAPDGSLLGEYRVTPGKRAAEYSASRLPVDPAYSGPLDVELRVLRQTVLGCRPGSEATKGNAPDKLRAGLPEKWDGGLHMSVWTDHWLDLGCPASLRDDLKAINDFRNQLIAHAANPGRLTLPLEEYRRLRSMLQTFAKDHVRALDASSCEAMLQAIDEVHRMTFQTSAFEEMREAMQLEAQVQAAALVQLQQQVQQQAEETRRHREADLGRQALQADQQVEVAFAAMQVEQLKFKHALANRDAIRRDRRLTTLPIVPLDVVSRQQLDEHSTRSAEEHSAAPLLHAASSSRQQLEEHSAGATPRSAATEVASSSSGASTILTITIEGSLTGPPPFDSGAFKARLAEKLDMRSDDQFKVRLVKQGGRRQHEVQTSPSFFVRVEVDEQGYLSYESSSSESASASGSESSDFSAADREAAGGEVTMHVKRALRPHRVAAEAIEVLWVEEGSIVVGLHLDLPYALKLIDLHQSKRLGEEFSIVSCVLGEQRPSVCGKDDAEEGAGAAVSSAAEAAEASCAPGADGAGPTGSAPRLGPSARGPRRRAPQQQRVVKVGRFEVNLDRVLGSGGFAQVFRAVDRTASPPLYVAAKHGAAAELRKEEQAVKLVAGHPAVIGLHGFVEDPRPGGKAFLFLEMCSGGELFERVSDGGPLSERAALPIAKGIAEALRHCLSRGVVHRNVGLENVMLSAEDPNALKLIDFNLACMVPLAPDGSIEPVLLYDGVGAPTYMAPELWFASSGYHAPPVDCWAYGVLVFMLLSGFPPFEAASTAAGNWRWSRFVQGVAGGAGACDALYGMYNRPCPFSPPAREFCDALLVIDANTRATIEQCLEHPWLSSPPPTATADIAAPAPAAPAR